MLSATETRTSSPTAEQMRSPSRSRAEWSTLEPWQECRFRHEATVRKRSPYDQAPRRRDGTPGVPRQVW
jgi:hypothetical protein